MKSSKQTTKPLTYKDIFGWFDFEDIYRMIYKHLPQEGGIFVEVGSFLGKSTAYFCELMKKGNKNVGFIQVDTWLGTPGEHEAILKEHNGDLYPKFCENITNCGFKDYITPYQMTSLEASKRLPFNLLDAVFLDAGHSFEDISNDINYWYPKVKQGGIIAGHDIDFPSVWRAVRWDKRLEGFQYKGRSWWVKKHDLIVDNFIHNWRGNEINI